MPTHAMPSISAMPMSSSLHLQNYYSHPANTRLLLGNISQGSGKGHRSMGGAVPKPPKPPEKPLMPYMRYSRKVWDDVKANNPDLKLWEIGKIIGQQWRELPTLDKQQYIEEYEVEKIEHSDQLKHYHNSPAYQAYLHAKSRAEAMESADPLGDKDDAYMSIEPTDEGADDSDFSFSVKHVAAARFQRNHRLINDILGETTPVPSTRSVVTTQRLNVLKNQVQSLELHQKKLEAELVHLENTLEQKKRKLITQARDFEREMKRLRTLTPQEYYKEHKQKQQQNASAQEKPKPEAKKEKEDSQANDKQENQGKENNSKDGASATDTTKGAEENSEAEIKDVESQETKPDLTKQEKVSEQKEEEEKMVVDQESEDVQDTTEPEKPSSSSGEAVLDSSEPTGSENCSGSDEKPEKDLDKSTQESQKAEDVSEAQEAADVSGKGDETEN